MCLLRPVSFFENILEQLPLIDQLGVFADAVAPDLRFPMVATRDIAAVAADALVARDWTGVIVRELLGPRDLTHGEIATIVGERLGRPGLQYEQLSYAEIAAALEQGGLSTSFARLYCETTQALNDGRVQPRKGRTRDNSTATTFEQFLERSSRRTRRARNGSDDRTVTASRRRRAHVPSSTAAYSTGVAAPDATTGTASVRCL